MGLENHDQRKFIGLGAIIAALLLAAEGVARFAVPNVSEIENRRVREWQQAATLVGQSAAGRSVLLLGNSLLGAAVDMDELRNLLAPELSPHRLLMEDTSYLDIFFGLKRLLEQGSEPYAVVVMLSAAQLASDRVRGGYSAFFLLQLSDIVPAGRRGDLSPTEISQLFFARVSAYYARREGIRQFVGSQLLPNYAAFSDVISRRAPSVEEPDAAELRVVMESRLAELGELCAEHGLRCIFAVAPGLPPASPQLETLLLAGETSDIPLLFEENDWAATDFRPDGFHMNESGAREYTPILARGLRSLLIRPEGPGEGTQNPGPGQ